MAEQPVPYDGRNHERSEVRIRLFGISVADVQVNAVAHGHSPNKRACWRFLDLINKLGSILHATEAVNQQFEASQTMQDELHMDAQSIVMLSHALDAATKHCGRPKSAIALVTDEDKQLAAEVMSIPPSLVEIDHETVHVIDMPRWAAELLRFRRHPRYEIPAISASTLWLIYEVENGIPHSDEEILASRDALINSGVAH